MNHFRNRYSRKPKMIPLFLGMIEIENAHRFREKPLEELLQARSAVVRSTVDSLSRSPAIFRNARSAPWAKLPNMPAIATISSHAAVSLIGFNCRARSHGL